MLKRNLVAATLGAATVLTVTVISATEANAAVLELGLGILELGLGIDASSSISPANFNLQIDAYENIFRDDFVGNFLSSNPTFNTIVVSATLFASSPGETTGWFTITNDVAGNAQADLFADAVGSLTRTGGNTAIGDTIAAITDDIFSNGIDSDR